MNTKQYGNSTTIGGLVLIVLGVVFFAITQGAFNLSWGNIWPIFPMIVGIFILVQAFSSDNLNRRAGMVLGGTIPLLLGAFFFATTLNLVSWSDQGVLWPVYPLIVGVAFIAAYLASDRQQRGYLVPGMILLAVGVVFLGILLVDESYSYLGRLWPLALIIVGVLMLLPRVRRTRS